MDEQLRKGQENKQESNKNNTALLLRFLKGSKGFFIASILCSAFTTLADMISPQIIRMAIDNCLSGKPSDFPGWVNRLVESAGGFSYLAQHLYILALVLAALAVLRAASQFATTLLNTQGSEILVKNMRDQLFFHIQRLPYAWHAKNHTGDLIQRCTTDVDRIRTFVAEQLTQVFRILILIAMSLYFMFSMNVPMAWIAVLPVPVVLFYSVFFRKDMQEGFLHCDEQEGKVSSMVQENLTGVRVVRAFAAERRETDKFQAENEKYTSLWVDLGRIMGRFFSVQDVLSGLQILGVTVFGAVFAVHGRMTPGEYIAFLSYNAMMSFPIRRLGRMLSEMSKAGVSLDRLAYIMDAEEEKDAPGSVDADLTGDIDFSHVSFSYEGEGSTKSVLEDVSFTVKAGTTLGILGGTGSGKSTLMLLLDRLYELPEGQGSISIGGRDIRTIRLACLRKNIAMVLQDPYLFSRTIEENIGIARENIAPEAIVRAAKDACLAGTLEGFSAGYKTFVGERGVTLSGGQKQRTAIARAFTQEAPIMVFDDSLSAVDSVTDAMIREALQKRFGTATIILISHRITTLSKADMVVVLEDGKVSEIGTPAQLESSGGVYQKIYEIQMGAQNDGR